MRSEVIETGFGFGDLAPLPENIQGIVIHHSGEDDVDLSAADIHRIHLGNKWSGIGYHFVDRWDGTVERGRPEWAQGAHSPGANRFTLGVHVAGCFSGRLPGEAQLQALVNLLADLCEKYGLNPMGQLWNGKDVISGHRDWIATECPGQMLYSILPQIRQQVAEAIAQGGVA